MTYHLHSPHIGLAKIAGISERKLAQRTSLSRSCLRQISESEARTTLTSLVKLADFFGLDVEVALVPRQAPSGISVSGAALNIERDGFNSWKIHLMNFVDEFRRTLDPRLISIPPDKRLDPRLRALFASVVLTLCNECRMLAPSWAQRSHYLDRPWFPAEMESLRASAIQESPYEFRKNNIFVHDNFLSRV